MYRCIDSYILLVSNAVIVVVAGALGGVVPRQFYNHTAGLY